MNRGASSSSRTTQYEKPTSSGQGLIKFSYNTQEISSKVEALIKKNKELNLTEDNIRDDYENMARELLSQMLPFALNGENEIKKLEEEKTKLLREMQAANLVERSSGEAAATRIEFKENKKRLNALKMTVKSLNEIMQHFLSEENIKTIRYHIEDYCDGRKRALGYESDFNIDSTDYFPESIQKDVNNYLDLAKAELLRKFPMHFDKADAEFHESFLHLPSKHIDSYKLRYAQSIAHLKRSELSAISSSDDSTEKKDYSKEQILYSAQISQLQYDILQEMSKPDPGYVENVINAALEPILKQFARGESFGAYKFKYPGSIKEQLQIILHANSTLLLDRERNEINLELYNEQYACYSALADNPSKYGITTFEEGRLYEALKKQASDSREKAQVIQAKLNHQLAQIIERFIDERSIKENAEHISEIQQALGVDLKKQSLPEIMRKAEQSTQLGYYDWMFTKTFASRCKRALLMATTMGAVGVGVGGVAGLGIFSAFTAGVGGISGGVTGLITGFTAPNIEQAASSNIGELRNLAITLFYGEQNQILKEYFADPSNTRVLNSKYIPTERMIEAWGADGADIIAYQYANLLFELHIKILYGSEAENKEELEQKYRHFYRNYQMIRGDESEIRNIYRGDFFGADRADNEIEKLARLNIREQAVNDLATLTLIVTDEEKRNIRKLRTVINDVADGLQLLTNEKEPKLLKQALEAPEVRRILPAFERDIVPQPLMITLVDTDDPQLSASTSASPSGASSSSSPSGASSSSSPSGASSSAYPLALIPSIQADSQKIVTYDPVALEKQKLVTKVKVSVTEMVQASQKREEIRAQYVKINSLANIARNADTTTSDMETVKPGYVRSNTQFIGDMSACDATTFFVNGKQAHFKYWYNNIFLYNHKSSSNEARKALISRELRDGNGDVKFEGKSLWHVLAENSVAGRKLFSQMMRAESTAGFSPFIDYFDFNYKPIDGMNAIVYAASLSTPGNSGIFSTYVHHLLKGYKSGTEDQVNCDRTFKEVLHMKSPHNPAYQIICMKIKDEIHDLWLKRENQRYYSKSIGQRMISIASKPIRSSKSFDADAVMSQLLATMAVYCVDGNPIPQTEGELVAFINSYRKSSYISEETQTLLNNIDSITHIAKVTQEVSKNNPLYEFSKDYPDEKIRNLAIELCTSMPIPTPEEQKILIAILSNNIPYIEQLIINKNTILSGLINDNTKFKEKNIVWIAIEANRPEITAKLYSIANHEAMDKAGPNEASAFNFAASQQDKTTCNLLCRSITERSGLVTRAYVSRMKPDSTGAIGFHYLSQTGSIDDIIQYFQTETRYSSPDWHRLTGGPVKSTFYIDQNGNVPIHLLLSRDNAVDIMRAIHDYATSSNIKLNTLFDLFAIESFGIRNANGTTPISLIMRNESLKRIFFEPLLEKVRSLYADVNYRKQLFAYARFALEYGDDQQLPHIMECIKYVHTNNYSRIYANPVDAEVDEFLDYLISRINMSSSEREGNILSELLRSSASLASAAKLKSICAAASNVSVNQLIIKSVFPVAIDRKIITDDGRLRASSSASSSADSSPSASPTLDPRAEPDRIDDASTRATLLLSGGHQITERENSSSNAPSEPQQRKEKHKKKRDQT